MSPTRHEHRVEAEVRAVVGTVVDRVLTTVAEVGEAAVASFREARARGGAVRREDLGSVRGPVLDLLGAEGCLPVGLGVIVAPAVLDGQSLFLEWWQSGPDLAGPTRLEVDLNAHSVGFYDYVAAPWFQVPQRTGLPHVVGPYVDVHGTDRYVLTFTRPLLVDGAFVGVAGADVPVGRLESLVLRTLGATPADVVVVGDDDRVVLSTSPRWLVGSLLTASPPSLETAGARSSSAPGVPWRILTWPRGGVPPPA